MHFSRICLSVTKDQFRVKIGLEIHARIFSKTKIFSHAETSSLVNTQSNSKVSYFDAALPGTMPTLNKRCVEAAILTGLALNCKINAISYFERKHYFYPDLPAGYQITQQNKPIAIDGSYDYPIYDRKINKLSFKSCKIKQIQLEHDSARTILMNDLNNNNKNETNSEFNLIDLNRCGLGLMEIVTEPNFQNAFETSSFVYDLSNLLKSLNVCEVNMKDGGFRVDVNISVHKLDKNNNEEASARIELKNINNLNSIRKAIDYEINRQIKLKLENKQHEIRMQTRGYDSVTETTYLMRNKESFYDYRFMPEPNLLPLFVFTTQNTHLIESNKLICDDIDHYNEYKESVLNSNQITGINIDDIIELRKQFKIPREIFNLLIEKYHLKAEQAYMIVTNKFDELFMKLVNINEDMNKLTQEIATIYYNCLFYEYSEMLNKNSDYKNILTAEKLADYVLLIKSNEISKRLGKILFQLMVKDENLNKLPKQICLENDLVLNKDRTMILNVVNNILNSKDNLKSIKNYHLKEKKRDHIFTSLVNQIQNEFNQRADSTIVRELLTNGLNSKKP